jgi:hypothetical protein
MSTAYENDGWTWDESSLVIRLCCCLDVPRVILYSLHEHKALSATFEKQLKKKLFLLTDERCLPVHPSFCPYATARLLPDGLPWNFVFGGFYYNFSIPPEFDENQAEITIYTKTYEHVRYLAVVFIVETAMSWGRRKSWRSEPNNLGWSIANLPVYNINTKDTIFHCLRHINYDGLQACC